MDLRGKNIEGGYFNLVTVEGDSNATSGKLQDGQGTDLGNIAVGGLSFNSADSEFSFPAGTTAERPSSPSAGYARYNTDTGKLEIYTGNVWLGIVPEGLVQLGVATATVTANDGVAENVIFGTTWATTSALNVAVYAHGYAGSTSSALSFAGQGVTFTTNTEKWNGSTWATTSATNASRAYHGSVGTASDALAVAGFTGAGTSAVEIWATSSWATTTAYPVSSWGIKGVGTVSDAISFGGRTGSVIGVTLNYNWSGSAWASTSALNGGRYRHSAFGSTTSAIASEGQTSSAYINTTEKWNGSSWATTSASTTSSTQMGHSNTGDTGISFGGNTGADINTSRVWDGSVWATTTNYPISVNILAGVGDAESALGFGGETGGAIANSYLWS